MVETPTDDAEAARPRTRSRGRRPASPPRSTQRLARESTARDHDAARIGERVGAQREGPVYQVCSRGSGIEAPSARNGGDQARSCRHRPVVRRPREPCGRLPPGHAQTGAAVPQALFQASPRSGRTKAEPHDHTVRVADRPARPVRAVETPSPTHTCSAPAARVAGDRSSGPGCSTSCADPVTPMVERGVDEAARRRLPPSGASRSGAERGATRNTLVEASARPRRRSTRLPRPG